jgi:hypothetical protein
MPLGCRLDGCPQPVLLERPGHPSLDEKPHRLARPVIGQQQPLEGVERSGRAITLWRRDIWHGSPDDTSGPAAGRIARPKALAGSKDCVF